MRRHAALTILALLTSTGLASAAPQIVGIDVMVFDRQKANLVPLEKLPDDFGRDADLFFAVHVKDGADAGVPSPPPKLVLELSSPAYSDEASGDHPAWKLTVDRLYLGAGETGDVVYPLLMPYPCRLHVTVSARLGASSRSIKTKFPCGE